MRIAAIGDNVIDLYTSDRCGFVGGNSVNVAAYAKRSGAEHSAYLGVVGTDECGAAVIDALHREGVDIAGVRRTPGTTAWCEISHAEGDRRFIASDKGVSLFEYGPEWGALLEGYDVIHTAYSGGLEGALGHISQKAPVFFDFSHRHDTEYIARIAPHIEFAGFSGGGLELDGCWRLAETARSLGASQVLVTRGRQGAIFLSDEGSCQIAAREIEVVDTLGAGDTFIATFLVERFSGTGIEESLHAATEHAARTCLQYGGFGSALTSV